MKTLLNFGALAVAIAAAQLAHADTIQPLTLPTVAPGLFLQATAVRLTYTASSGELKVYGSGTNNGVLLNNNCTSPNPVISNVSGSFLLDVFLDHSTSNIKMTSGTLSITDGGTDVSAAVPAGANFGFDFGSSSSEFDMLLTETGASVLPEIQVGSLLGEKVIISSSTFAPDATFNTNFSYTTGLAGKSDTFAAAPTPSVVLGGLGLSGLLGVTSLLRRRVLA